MTKWWFAGSIALASKKEAIDVIIDMLGKFIKDGDSVRTGGAVGIDRMVETAIMEMQNRKDVTLEPSLIPNWKMGRGAGMIRNKEGVDWSDRVLCIWDGKSPGTKNVINYAKKQSKLEEVVIV